MIPNGGRRKDNQDQTDTSGYMIAIGIVIFILVISLIIYSAASKNKFTEPFNTNKPIKNQVYSPLIINNK